MKEKMFKRAANSFAGRMLRRLCGEETGAVMLEYIVIALLIIVVGVVVFSMLGGVLTGTGDVVAGAVAGDTTSNLDQGMNNVRSGISASHGNAQNRVNNLHKDNTSDWGRSNSNSGSGN